MASSSEGSDTTVYDQLKGKLGDQGDKGAAAGSPDLRRDNPLDVAEPTAEGGGTSEDLRLTPPTPALHSHPALSPPHTPSPSNSQHKPPHQHEPHNLAAHGPNSGAEAQASAPMDEAQARDFLVWWCNGQPLAELVDIYRERWTALHWAMAKDEPALVRAILKQVDNLQFLTQSEQFLYVGWLDERGTTALHLAAKHNSQAAAAELLHLAPTEHLEDLLLAVDADGATPLHVACAAGHVGLVDALLAVRPPRSTGVLLSSLLSSTASWSYADQQPCTGLTALHMAVLHGHAKVVTALLRHLKSFAPSKVEEFMLQFASWRTARITQSSSDPVPDRCSALHLAVQQGHADVVAALLHFAGQYDYGSNYRFSEPWRVLSRVLSQKTGDNCCSVFHLVTEVDGIDKAMAVLQVLLEQCIWIKDTLEPLMSARNSGDGWTPKELFMHAPQDLLSQLFNFILEEWDHVDDERKNTMSLIVAWLHSYAQELDDVFYNNRYPIPEKGTPDSSLLHCAIKCGHMYTARWMLDLPFRTARSDQLDWHTSKSLRYLRWVVQEDASGCTAWHYAAKSGNKVMLQLLVQHDRYLMFEPSLQGDLSSVRDPNATVGTPEEELKAGSEAERWWQGLKVKKMPRRQIIADTCSGLLVGSAVIAGVAFTAVYNPPRGWVDGRLPTDPKGLHAFHCLNCLSLYCALCSLIVGAGMSLPQPELQSPRQELRSMVRWVFYTTLLLMLAVVFNAGAFAVAILSCVTSGAHMYGQLVQVVGVGAALTAACVAIVGRPLWRLLRAEDMIGKDCSRGELLLGHWLHRWLLAAAQHLKDRGKAITSAANQLLLAVLRFLQRSCASRQHVAAEAASGSPAATTRGATAV